MKPHLRVAGTGSHLPPTIISNNFFTTQDLYAYDEHGTSRPLYVGNKKITPEKIVSITGIHERRKANADQVPSDLAYVAARNALANAGIEASALTGIIFATISQESNVPSAACKLQEALEIPHCTFAFDINDACAGFTKALIVANGLAVHTPGNYLVVGAECLTRIVDYTDINSTLFGDGAGAAVLVPSENERGILACYSGSVTGSNNTFAIFRDARGRLRMPHGQKVMKNAVNSMMDASLELKQQVGWQCADIYIPHQANQRIIESIQRRVEIGERVYSNIANYGNTSAATCAIALDEALRGETIKPGHKVIMTAFGAGFVTGGVALQF